MPRWLALGLLLLGGCATAGGSGPPTPDATSSRWRALTGCYRLGDGDYVVLDSLPDAKLNADLPGVRRALFVPKPAIVGGSWYVSEGGAVWLFRHDGLWGRSYELATRGDSLVGHSFVRTDVVGADHPPQPATAVRVASCPAPEAASS